MNLLYTYPETIVDGDGIRFSIYFAGCPHRCKGCHNEQGQDPKSGTPLTDEKLSDIIKEVNNNPLLDGITLSGGDPFFNPSEMLPIVERVKKETGLSIWCYTGFLIEQLLKRSECVLILKHIDVLVDGLFIQSKYSPTLNFRGSSNQRILRVAHYLKQS